MNRKILILQFREGYVRINEQLAFRHRFKDHTEDILFVNALDTEAVFPGISNLDGVIIGGSGDVRMIHDHDWYDRVEAYLFKIIENNIPLLGICFGHQILARMYGASVEDIPEQKEVGTVAITLNPRAQSDPLFKGLNQTFYSIAGHNDSVRKLPKNFELLASNKTCPIQAFRILDQQVYGVQFHPELDEKDFQTRLEYYKDHYIEAGQDYNKIFAKGDKPTTDQVILQNFYDIAHYTAIENGKEAEASATASVAPANA